MRPNFRYAPVKFSGPRPASSESSPLTGRASEWEERSSSPVVTQAKNLKASSVSCTAFRILSVVAVGASLLGCSEQAEDRNPKPKALDHAVLNFRSEAPLDDVKAQLGEPRLERDLGEETAIYYGRWQLVFIDSKLDNSTRYYEPRHTLSGYRLGREIRTLQPGTAVAAVRAKLGKPEAIQIYGGPSEEEQVLWYREWSLSFESGELRTRTKF